MSEANEALMTIPENLSGREKRSQNLCTKLTETEAKSIEVKVSPPFNQEAASVVESTAASRKGHGFDCELVLSPAYSSVLPHCRHFLSRLGGQGKSAKSVGD